MPGRVHDRALLDALEAVSATAFDGDAWRITRQGYDPLRGSVAQGRWSSNGAFEVLYTSLERDGALAEVGYRLALEPVWPSKLRHDMHRIAAVTSRTLRFADVGALVPLGVDAARYATFDYTATQAIAAAAHFLEFDGLIVPSARAPCANLVVFMDRIAETGTLAVTASEALDWTAWRAQRRGA